MSKGERLARLAYLLRGPGPGPGPRGNGTKAVFFFFSFFKVPKQLRRAFLLFGKLRSQMESYKSP